MVNCCEAEASATEGRKGIGWHAGRLRSRRIQIHDFGWRVAAPGHGWRGCFGRQGRDGVATVGKGGRG